MTDPADGYMLGCGLGPSIRPTTQDWLWKKKYGWNIYPEAEQKWQAEAVRRRKITDIGTGNAIWLIEEAVRHPTNTYVGFDINPSQLPHQETLPHNMTLHILDATGIVPENYLGTFDAINIRLLVPAICGNNPRPVLLNALRMFKPGDFLQWGEIVPRLSPSGDLSTSLLGSRLCQ